MESLAQLAKQQEKTGYMVNYVYRYNGIQVITGESVYSFVILKTNLHVQADITHAFFSKWWGDKQTECVLRGYKYRSKKTPEKEIVIITVSALSGEDERVLSRYIPVKELVI